MEQQSADETSRSAPKGPKARVARAVGRLWLRPRVGSGDEAAGETRAVFVRILIFMVWMPIQVTLSLIFATGGIFFLLLFGVTLGPFVALYLLIRHAMAGEKDPSERPQGGSEAVPPPGE